MNWTGGPDLGDAINNERVNVSSNTQNKALIQQRLQANLKP